MLRTEVSGAGALGGVGQPAPVVGAVVAPGAFEALTAACACHEATQGVAAGCGPPPEHGCVDAGGDALLGGVERVGVDEGVVGPVGGPDPLLAVLGADALLRAHGDVFDVDEGLGAEDFVPDLVTEVAGVGQDRADRRA